jgi:hypothetical protein
VTDAKGDLDVAGMRPGRANISGGGRGLPGDNRGEFFKFSDEERMILDDDRSS